MNENTINGHKLYRPNTTLSFNISPGLSRQHIGTSYKERKRTMITETTDTLKVLPGFKYKLWLEISRYGLLHWHGVLTVVDSELTANSLAILKYKMNDLRVELDTIENLDHWLAYCSKDAEIMKTTIQSGSRKTNINDFFKKKVGKRPRGAVKCPPEPSNHPESIIQL